MEEHGLHRLGQAGQQPVTRERRCSRFSWRHLDFKPACRPHKHTLPIQRPGALTCSRRLLPRLPPPFPTSMLPAAAAVTAARSSVTQDASASAPAATASPAAATDSDGNSAAAAVASPSPPNVTCRQRPTDDEPSSPLPSLSPPLLLLPVFAFD